MIRLLVATAIVFVVATGASAQAVDRFARMDLDQDGKITLQEFETVVGNQFRQGKGRKAEFFRSLSPEKQAAILQKRFQRLDRGNKGYLVPDDLPQQRRRA